MGHFHVQNALVFANFAYYDRELCCLVVSGGQSAEKIRWPKMSQLGLILAPKRSWYVFLSLVDSFSVLLHYNDS